MSAKDYHLKLVQPLKHFSMRRLEGVIFQMNNIMVHGKSKEEHYDRERAGITRKSGHHPQCEFEVTKAKCIGYIIDHKGIREDPEKTRAARNFPVL